jgi:putative membrane protein
MTALQRSNGNEGCASMAAGALGGLLGSWVMNQFQGVVKRAKKNGREEEPATVQTAEMVSDAVLDRPLSSEEKQVAGPAVHYVFGALVGAVYGGLAETAPRATMCAGMGYGAAVWLLADEVAVPAAGLSRSPLKTSAVKHLEALASHLVYGLTMEGTRRLFRMAVPVSMKSRLYRKLALIAE